MHVHGCRPDGHSACAHQPQRLRNAPYTDVVPHSVAVATALAIPVAGLGAAVMALDVQEPATDMLMRAAGFSPWGAAMVYIAWQARKDVKTALNRLAALWEETIVVVAPWSDRARDLSSAIRESHPGGAPPEAATRSKPRRPKTDPVNITPLR